MDPSQSCEDILNWERARLVKSLVHYVSDNSTMQKDERPTRIEYCPSIPTWEELGNYINEIPQPPTSLIFAHNPEISLPCIYTLTETVCDVCLNAYEIKPANNPLNVYAYSSYILLRKQQSGTEYFHYQKPEILRKYPSSELKEHMGNYNHTFRYYPENMMGQEKIETSFVDPLTFLNIALKRDECVKILGKDFIYRASIRYFNDTVQRMRLIGLFHLQLYLITVAKTFDITILEDSIMNSEYVRTCLIGKINQELLRSL